MYVSFINYKAYRVLCVLVYVCKHMFNSATYVVEISGFKDIHLTIIGSLFGQLSTSELSPVLEPNYSPSL